MRATRASEDRRGRSSTRQVQPSMVLGSGLAYITLVVDRHPERVALVPVRLIKPFRHAANGAIAGESPSILRQSLCLCLVAENFKLVVGVPRRKATEPWARLYIRRWLESPVQKQTGELVARDRGTPQGGVISPLLANLFLHYAFDRWVPH